MPALPVDTSQIVITAARSPQNADETAASITIVDHDRIERLGEPLIAALLRQSPSTAITTSGPAGSLTEVRIRGAEANHSLLFVDGIKLNDPAGDDSARFELLNADLASRIEIIRGPQSALWGSDALGGVIAVNGLDDPRGYQALIEGGSFGSARAAAAAGAASSLGSMSAAIGWQRSTGIDSFGAPGGDKDGYDNLSGRARGALNLAPSLTLGAAGIVLSGSSQFDGYNLQTFVHEDTLDSSRNLLAAGRLWLQFGRRDERWSGHVSASRLTSSNRNLLDSEPINRTRGTRTALDAQVEHRFATGAFTHRLILAGEAERERFAARDVAYGGLTDQNRDRAHQSLTAEWRGEFEAANLDVAVRRDLFNRFADATSLRASVLIPVSPTVDLTASYADGVSQPTFVDLHGFYPSNFVGNPSLRPESSRGFEAGVRYRRAALEASLTAYRQELRDEIVIVGDPVTFLLTALNSTRDSRRSGIEASVAWHAGDRLRLSGNYAYLHATEPDDVTGKPVTEARRPKHSGGITADGKLGPWNYGATLAYVGDHFDSRDNYPYDTVRLGSYWLAAARVGYKVAPGAELFVRGANLLDRRYRDAVGYNTEPRGLFVGVRLGGRRSSP